MSELIKRLMLYTLVIVVVLLLLLLLFKPIQKPVFDILAVALRIKASIYTFTPIQVIIGGTGWSSTVVGVSSGASSGGGGVTSPSPIWVPFMNVSSRSLVVKAVFQGEESLRTAIDYNVIELPPSQVEVRKVVNYSGARAVLVYSEGNKTVVELVPYFNYSVRGETLVIDLYLFKCNFTLKKRVVIRFVGFVAGSKYARSYEAIGLIEVYFNEVKVVSERAKYLMLRVHYEVWSIG